MQIFFSLYDSFLQQYESSHWQVYSVYTYAERLQIVTTKLRFSKWGGLTGKFRENAFHDKDVRARPA